MNGRFSAAVVLVGCLSAAAPVTSNEPIGTVFGEPVYRHQLRSDDPSRLHSELHQLFTTPVLERYRAEHQAQITPSAEELEEAAAYFNRQHEKRMAKQRPELQSELAAINVRLEDESLTDKEQGELELRRTSIEMRLKPPGDLTAKMLVGKWRWERYLYNNYGGGRVLFQQFGLEAFDAMHRWLKEREQQGDFQITDDGLRKAFYAYWTTHDHGSFLSGDPERVEALTTPFWRQEGRKPLD